MANKQAEFSRLLDLPGEIRNHIYREVLCCFDPIVPTAAGFGINQGVIPATHSVDIAILRTCRQVHREAYDVMVKTNQFIKISSVDIDLARLLLSSGLPVVTMDRAVAGQFQGCVMSVDLSVVPGDWVGQPWDGDGHWEEDFNEEIHAQPAGTGPQFNFLILGRDWSSFCHMLSEGTAFFERFEKNVKIELKMNAWPEHIPDYKATIAHYFTADRQATLLGSFGSILRNFENVVIGGTIDEHLAISTVRAVAGRQWTSHEDVIHELSARKDTAKTASSQDSLQMYMDAVMLMRRIYGSADFSRLVEEGDVAFVSSFAELYFTVLLDACQPILEIMRSLEFVRLQAWSNVIYEHVSLAQESLDNLAEDGSIYEPTSVVMAQLAYIIAVCSRLLGQALPQDHAVDTIMTAVRLNPTDAAILAERDRITGWRRALVPTTRVSIRSALE
ncbi:uncharacterized protein CC84DRAFT_1102964 [Paraphaeosphaeria sporulosa]|uniref:Uncharacterized protein n=1 Tax=Paraphaeosphaeria sporulosa TaxID=1460663 RepID=A0A177BZX2_9PLEO|nr:uncharacterized protein CC84DRAFT_1102964 [Paraphaeosphaeria sporulosa]OAF99899.1 hypothetical protein CC84DRAFT_1102964 [Paraphaeosphaeria sporulosa]